MQSSGLNAIVTLNSGDCALVTCILISGTTAASWDLQINAQRNGDVNQTFLVAPATLATQAVQLGQFTSNLPALLRTRGYYGLLDNYNMTRLPTNGAAPITVGANPYGVAYCPTNDRIYVANLSSNSVSVIIPATGVVTATITVGTSPQGVAYCPTNDRIYVANNGSATVSVLT